MFKSLEETAILIKGISETIKSEAKILGIVGASLLRNLLIGKGIIKAGETTVRASENV